MGVAHVVVVGVSSTLPVIVPGLATMPASQVRSDSPESSTVWAVLLSVALASLSLASLPVLAVVAARRVVLSNWTL